MAMKVFLKKRRVYNKGVAVRLDRMKSSNIWFLSLKVISQASERIKTEQTNMKGTMPAWPSKSKDWMGS